MGFIMTRVHGNAVVAQPPADVGLPQGPGKKFQGAQGQSNWFHIPLPTVSWLDATPLFLDQFFIFFTTSGDACGVDEIRVFDGGAQIWLWPDPMRAEPPAYMFGANWNRPNQSPPDRQGIITSNTWPPRKPLVAGEHPRRFQVYTGIGISVHVNWRDGDGDITFHSAGASFVDTEFQLP